MLLCLLLHLRESYHILVKATAKQWLLRVEPQRFYFCKFVSFLSFPQRKGCQGLGRKGMLQLQYFKTVAEPSLLKITWAKSISLLCLQVFAVSAVKVKISAVFGQVGIWYTGGRWKVLLFIVDLAFVNTKVYIAYLDSIQQPSMIVSVLQSNGQRSAQTHLSASARLEPFVAHLWSWNCSMLEQMKKVFTSMF